MSESSYFTAEGLEKLRAELQELKTKGRANIARMISEAREKGDLKENAEYDAAREAQGLHEARIAKLENLIANAKIVDETKLDLSKVSILTTVRVKNLQNNAEFKYTLVSQQEANFKENKISVDSPVAKGLLGKAVGETAEISVPAGTMRFEILEIMIE